MARKIKLPDTILHHENVHVRLTAQNLLLALEAAKAGNIVDMATYIRIAREFEVSIPASIRLGGEYA